MTVSQDSYHNRQPGSHQRGRDEMNLVEFPFATLLRRPSMGSIKCQRWISDAQGQRHAQRWVVQGGSESGLPTEFDERVYVALMAVTKQQGLAQRKVTFSVYQLLKIMGESTDNRHYRSVERSLERLLRASIVAEGAFWDGEQKKLVQLMNGFHLIEKYWLAYKELDREKAREEGAQGYLVWGQEIWSSLQSGYLKQLDLDLFFSLQTPVARRLYRFLDKKLHQRQRLEIDIFQLSQQLGMAWYRYPAKVKEKLQPGIDELIAAGFLASGEMIKVDGYTRMRFVKGQGKPKATPQSNDTREKSSPVVQESCGQYGCFASQWRQQMARKFKVPAEQVKLWEKVLKKASKKLSPVLHQIWLARTLLLELQDGEATILVPDAFFRNRIQSHHETLLRALLADQLGTSVRLSYRSVKE